MIYKVYKKIGETPLQALQRFRKENYLVDGKFTYAGRLDPMAEGVMFILSGNDVYKKEEFTKKDKKYIVQVLFGIKTDTGDLLGRICKIRNESMNVNDVLKAAKEVKGRICWKYPIFSGKTVNGRKLFDYYLKGELADIEVPTYEGEIKEISLRNNFVISAEELLANVRTKFNLIQGSSINEEYSDFRKDEILQDYEKLIPLKEKFFVFEFELVVTRGVFMRTFAEYLGEKLTFPSLAYSIKRTEILLN